jgi:hypothetical protein
MDVRGALVDRPEDQLVNQPDNRRLARQVFQAISIDGVIIRAGRHIHRFGCDHFVAAMKPLDRRFQFRRHGDAGLHRPLGEHADRLDREAIERIRHRQRDAVGIHRQRQDMRFFQEARADLVLQNRQVGIVALSDQGQTEMAGHCRREVSFGDKAQPRQELEQPLGRVGLEPKGPVETARVELPRLDERLAELQFG